MKKYIIVFIFCLINAYIFAAGASEESIREKYNHSYFPNREEWVYEFNSVAAEVSKYCKDIISGESWSTSFDKMQFDESCLKYKVLLDIGVEKKYINEEIKKFQLEKLSQEREKVSKFLSKSSGLGIE